MCPAHPVLLAALLTLGGVAPQKNSHLAEAESQVGSLRYSDAAKSLAKARADAGNDRATLLRILELTGVVEASLGHGRPATEAFSQLLYLNPTYRLGDEWGPKVKTPFYEARGWLGDHQPLQVKEDPPQLEPGRVRAVTLELGEDPLNLYRELRVHFLPASKDGKEAVVAKPAKPGTLSVEAPEAAELRYWVELVGAHDEVLGSAGDEAAPLLAKAPPAPAKAPEPKPAVVAAAKPEPKAEPRAAAGGLSQPAPEPEPRYRPAAYGLMGGGVAALAVGGVFGYQVRSIQARLDGAKRDAHGNIDPADLTQKDAFALDQASQRDAVIADVCFVAGGLATAAGLGLWVYGGQVAVAPAPGGGGEVLLSGRWP